jgi:hypothetical protein
VKLAARPGIGMLSKINAICLGEATLIIIESDRGRAKWTAFNLKSVERGNQGQNKINTEHFASFFFNGATVG